MARHPLPLCTALALCLALLSASLTGPASAQPPLITDAQRAQIEAVGRVNIGGFRSRGQCTGVLITPDQVLTAAHCVASTRTGKAHPLYRMHFVAGWHKGEHLGASTAADVAVHFAFRPSEGQTINTRFIGSDMALIKLKDPLEGITPIPISQRGLRPGPVSVFGYRSDRPHALSYYQGCEARVFSQRTLSLSCAVASGTSGAPVLQDQDGGLRVVGVVSVSSATGGAIKGLAARVDQLSVPSF